MIIIVCGLKIIPTFADLEFLLAKIELLMKKKQTRLVKTCITKNMFDNNPTMFS